jgi:hypothetical protein
MALSFAWCCRSGKNCSRIQSHPRPSLAKKVKATGCTLGSGTILNEATSVISTGRFGSIPAGWEDYKWPTRSCTFSPTERRSSTRRRLRHPSRSTCQKAKSFTRRVRLPADGKLWRFTILWEAGSAFATARFYPKMQKGIPGGFAGPPTESGFEVHNLGRARHAYFCRSAVLFAARRM